MEESCINITFSDPPKPLFLPQDAFLDLPFGTTLLVGFTLILDKPLPSSSFK